MTISLIDYWLKKGGVKEKERGDNFEKYVKEQLIHVGCKLCKRKKFTNAKGEKEEIDILFRVADKLFVCEAKCIHYPMEPVHVHNMLNQLETDKKGVGQALRKVRFIKENSSDFVSDIGNISNLEVIPLVITNYPLCSGYIRKDVLIVDITTVISYFSPATYGMRKSEEDILSYFKKPLDVAYYMEQMHFRYIPQTVQGMGLNIYCMDPYIPSSFEPIRQNSGSTEL